MAPDVLCNDIAKCHVSGKFGSQTSEKRPVSTGT